MIRCVVLRGSSAIVRLTIATRLTSTTSSHILSDENAPSSILQDANPEPPSSSKSSINYPPIEAPSSLRPFLPISPLMDPAFLLARTSHFTPKTSPSKQSRTPFQQQLAKNPYALALATPIRMCGLTREPLPRFFLQDYGLLEHPKTGLAYWMPRSLTSEFRKGEELEVRVIVDEHLRQRKDEFLKQEIEVMTTQGSKVIKDEELVDKTSVGAKEGTSSAAEQLNIPSIGPSAYTLSRKDLLHVIKDRKSGFGSNPHVRIVPSRLNEIKATKLLQMHSQWRPDMEDFVLELMRRRTVELMAKILRLKRGYVIGCKSWKDALAKNQVGAFLWTGNALRESEEGFENPPEFAILYIGRNKQRKVPVHNLSKLLGKEKMTRLSSIFRNGIFECPILAVKHKNMTVDVQMKLWKLQGYLAEYREGSGAEIQ